MQEDGLVKRVTVTAGVIVSVTAIVAALIFSWPHPRAASSGRAGWRTYHSRDIGFAMRYPGDWHLTRFQGVCEPAGITGAMVSNASGAYQNPQKPTSCSWPPPVSSLSPSSVFVLFDVFLGGPMRFEQTLPRDTHFPLTMAMLHPTNDGRRYASVILHGSNRYSVDLWSGPRASASDRRAVEQVLGSIRPWAPARPSPGYGRCLGTWEREPVPTGPLQAQVNGVDVGSSSDAWAVGTYEHLLRRSRTSSPGVNGPPVVSTPLAMHWDGTGWHLVPAPDPNLRPFGTGLVFRDVAEVGAHDVWAVGGGGGFGLVEHWDGTKWRVVPSPKVNLVDATLVAVAGTGPRDAWAVGAGGPHGGIGAVIERWNGTRWALSSVPDAGTRYTTADDVSAASPTDAWVVGQRWDRALALHWNGRTWRAVSSPVVRSPRLSSVVDLGPRDAWAVGTSYRNVNGAGPSHALIEQWDGNRWNLATIPALPPNSSLSQVSASNPSDIWAIGWGSDQGGTQRQIVLHFDGVRWSEAAPPRANIDQGAYRDVAGTPSGAWLVGTEASGTFYQPVRPFVARSCD